LQYTGSALVNRVETYRRMPHWNSHSRDIIENIRRFYTNAVLDADKQAAINLFLGVQSERTITQKLKRGGYREWYHKDHLEPAYVLEECDTRLQEFAENRADFWIEYYRPLLFTSLGKHFAYSMNSTLKLPGKTAKDVDHSPFQPHHAIMQPGLMQGMRKWMSTSSSSNLHKTHNDMVRKAETKHARNDVESFDANSTEYIVSQLMDPNVPDEEIAEYEGYINQYETLLDAPSTYHPDSKDRDVYQNAVRTAIGDRPDWVDEPPDRAYAAYVERSSPALLDNSMSTSRRDYGHAPAPFNYEKWVGGGGVQRKVTGDFSAMH